MAMAMAEASLPRRLYDATYGRVFAAVYDYGMAASEEAGLADKRAALVSRAEGRTLELGAGTGLNLLHYPDAATELVLSEPFGPMASQLRERASELAREVEVVEAPAESLPLADDSVDTVVGTLVLCTVDDPEAAVAEVARVLRPGGRFLFLEHVRSDDPDRARWQDRLHGPWFAFGHGCHCNRDTAATLRRSALEVERIDDGKMPKSPPIVRPLISGSARFPG